MVHVEIEQGVVNLLKAYGLLKDTREGKNLGDYNAIIEEMARNSDLSDELEEYLDRLNGA